LKTASFAVSKNGKANIIDYALMWLMSCLAIYSCGRAVASDEVGMFGMAFVTLGSVFSFLFRKFVFNARVLRLDGPIYAIVCIVAFTLARKLNVIFAEDTFPQTLMPSAWLLWMLVLCAPFLWRDSTLLFQAIPALAMFGFVGCYDTFKAVPLLFFVFLICFAILFARAHARDMQARAVESGFYGTNLLGDEDRLTMLREGPWRWAAGAEWALGSALLIVLLSFLGAPVVRQAAKPISGFVAVQSPKLRSTISSAAGADLTAKVTVGSGPVNLSATPLFEVSGEKFPTYLRVATYNYWTRRGWDSTWNSASGWVDRKSGAVFEGEFPDSVKEFQVEAQALPVASGRPAPLRRLRLSEFSPEVNLAQNELKFTVKSILATNEIPQSGNGVQFISENPELVSNVGVLRRANVANYQGVVKYVPENSRLAVNAPDYLSKSVDSALNSSPIPVRSKLLAQKICQQAKTDIERANLIKAVISRKIKYNTQVDAVPAGEDAAEYAMFERGEGYCDVFATNMVNMARAVKIPARYTVGYLADSSRQDANGVLTLLESDRHAWAELFFEGVGWVPFDPTEGAEVVPGGSRTDRNEKREIDWKQTLTIGINVLIGAALFCGLGFYVRHLRQPRTLDMVRAELDQQYLKFTSALWKFTGRRRLLNETTREYLARVGSQLGSASSVANELDHEFTEAMFGAPEVSDESLANIRVKVQNFQSQLQKLPKIKPANS
jgi:transglutaminase-like putative cysteine protease